MKISVLALAVSVSSMAFSQQKIPLSGSPARMQITSATSEGMIIETALPEVRLISVTKNNQTFQRLAVENYLNGSATGTPELPVFNQLIEIPTDAQVEVRILEAKTETIDLDDYGTGKLFPAQPSLSKSADPATAPFQLNAAIYGKNEFLKHDKASVATLGNMRAVTIGNLTIAPFSYNPTTNELTVTTEMRVEVVFKNANLNKQALLKKKYGSPVFSGAFSKLANHVEEGPQRDQIVTYPTTYVIVADPMFQTALQPFVQWKTKKGFKVIEAYTSNPQVGNTTTSIKNYLAGLYNAATASNPAPSYILLVGDIAQIPAFPGTDAHVTDLYYAEYDGGGDYFPDAYYGRFSANSVAELQPQIAKTLEYERYEFPDDAFLDHVVLISGVDASMAPTYGNGQINYGTSEYFNAAHGFNSHVWLYPASEGAVESDIMNAISQGCSFVNYTAHGYEEGWADPAIAVSDVSSFSNSHKYPTMIGNCCLTNTFTTQTCFGESLLRAADKGAIGYIGGSNVSYWNEDYWWGVGYKNIVVNPAYDAANLGAYDCVFHETSEPTAQWYVTQSQLIFAGNMAVTASNSDMTHYYWEIYHLMGDPSLMTYLTQADPMTVTHVPQDVVGITSLVVNAEPYAYVAVSVNGVLLDAKYTGTGSSVTLSFPAVNTIETLEVVVTKQNKQPYFGNVQLVSPTNTPFIVLNSHVNDDSQANNNDEVDFSETILLDVALKNIGDLTGNNVQAALSTTDSYVTIIDNLENWGTILAGQVETINASYTYQLAGNVPDQHVIDFLLTITDSDGHSWEYHIYVTVNAPLIEVLDLTISDPSGNNNGRLDAGETTQLTITARNIGHAALSLSNGTITTTSSPTLSITGGTSTIGLMAVNNVVTGTYTVSVSPGAGYGEQVNITNVVGTANYDDSKLFELIVGLMDEDFESNTLTEFPWNNVSASPWFTTTQTPYEGAYCSQSGDIADNSTSDLEITIDVLSNSEISFMKKVSSESGYDYLRFFIDGTEQGSWSGEADWTPETYAVTAGTHTFKWAYTKDESVSEGADAAWVDNILFPAMANPSASLSENTTNAISIYPNPANEVIFISCDPSLKGKKADLVIRDLQGKVIFTQSGIDNGTTTTVSTTAFAKGVYTVEWTCGAIKELKKIVKM